MRAANRLDQIFSVRRVRRANDDVRTQLPDNPKSAVLHLTVQTEMALEGLARLLNERSARPGIATIGSLVLVSLAEEGQGRVNPVLGGFVRVGGRRQSG